MMLTQMADATAAGEAIVVQRPRITTLIAEGTRWCRLTVVTGSPGAGKTMALALWAATEPGAVAWVSLDDYHNQPGVFWSYAVAVLRQSRRYRFRRPFQPPPGGGR